MMVKIPQWKLSPAITLFPFFLIMQMLEVQEQQFGFVNTVDSL